MPSAKQFYEKWYKSLSASQRRPRTAVQVKLPPGWYYIGDPRHFVHPTLWQRLASSEGAWTARGSNGRRLRGASFPTGGDGSFRGSDRKTYAVESGVLGAVPFALYGGRDRDAIDLVHGTRLRQGILYRPARVSRTRAGASSVGRGGSCATPPERGSLSATPCASTSTREPRRPSPMQRNKRHVYSVPIVHRGVAEPR
jgi:hypothetical protein